MMEFGVKTTLGSDIKSILAFDVCPTLELDIKQTSALDVNPILIFNQYFTSVQHLPDVTPFYFGLVQ